MARAQPPHSVWTYKDGRLHCHVSVSVLKRTNSGVYQDNVTTGLHAFDNTHNVGFNKANHHHSTSWGAIKTRAQQHNYAVQGDCRGRNQKSSGDSNRHHRRYAYFLVHITARTHTLLLLIANIFVFQSPITTFSLERHFRDTEEESERYAQLRARVHV